MKKKILGAISIVLVLCVAVGATLAYLQDTTKEVVNTFTFGNVSIDLTETGAELNQEKTQLEKTYKMIPGEIVTKDPTITVEEGSEESWVYIEIVESTTVDTYLDYVVNSTDWTNIQGTNVYYYKEVVDASADDVEISGIIGTNTGANGAFVANTVMTKDTVTKADIDALSAQDAVIPTLTFKAYAVQKEAGVDAAAAWAATFGAKA